MLEQIIALIATKKEVEAGFLSPSTKLEDLGFDSLDIMDLIFDIESCLQLQLPSDLPSTEYADLITIQDVSELVAKHGRRMSA